MDARLERYSAWVLAPDLPRERVAPTASCFICATPRTGSWLLCGLLASTGVAGRPHEWFLPLMEERNRRAWGARPGDDYLELARVAGATPNGVFGAKVMWTACDHDAAWDRWMAANGIEPLQVAYEDLLADPVGTGRRVLDFLGLTAERMTPLTLPGSSG